MTIHDEHWTRVLEDAERRISSIFTDSGRAIAEILGHDKGICTKQDAKTLLAKVLKCGDYHEQSCAIIATCDWTQAFNEMSEGRQFAAASAAAK